MLHTQIKPEPVIPVIGNYYVYPNHGVCVLRGISLMEGAGYSVKTYDFRPLGALGSAIKIPEMRLTKSGLRNIASFDDIKAALECATGNVRSSHEIWAKRASKMEDMISSGHPVSLAAVLRDTIGKKRHKKFQGNEFAGGVVRLADLDASYSEAQLGEKALSTLAGEASMVFGQPLSRMRSILLQALLSPDFNIKKFDLQDNATTFMDDNMFIHLFGVSKKESARVGSQLPEPKAISHPDFQKPKLEVPLAPRVETVTSGRRVSVAANKRGRPPSTTLIKEDLKDIHSTHAEFVASYGPKSRAFRFAAERQNPVEFELLCYTYFRRFYDSSVIEEFARTKSMDMELFWESAEASFNKMKSAIQASGKNYMDKETFKRNDFIQLKKATGRDKVAERRSIPEKNLAIYDAELEMASPNGAFKHFFVGAATHLEPEEFSIYSRMELRRTVYRLSAKQLAMEDGIDVAKVRAIRNAAAEKLAAYFPAFTHFYALKPLVDAPVREPRKPKNLEPLKPARVVEAKIKLSRADQQVQDIPEEIRAIFIEENNHAPRAGHMRGAFLQAAKILTLEQFSILSKTALRTIEKRISIEVAAEEMGRSVQDMIRIRNEASALLRASLGGWKESLFNSAAFNPYKPLLKVSKAASPENMGVPAHNRAVVDAEFSMRSKQPAIRLLFTKGAQVLTPDQLSILSKMSLRQLVYQVTPEAIAEAEGRDAAEIIAVRNEASAVLLAALGEKNKHMTHFSALRPFSPVQHKVQKSRVREPRVKGRELLVADGNKAIYDSEIPKIAKNGHTRRMFLRAAVALSPEHFDVLTKLELRSEFHRISIDALAKIQNITREDVIAIRNAASEVLRHSMGDGPSSVLRYAILNPYKENLKRGPRLKIAVSRLEKQLSFIPEANKPVFDAELPFKSKQGVLSNIFFKAAEVLTPQQFSIFARSDLRKKENRMDLADIAAQEKMSVDDIIAIRNESSAILRASFDGAKKHVSNFSALNPYKLPAVRKPQSPDMRTLKAEFVSQIVDGNFLLSIALPLDALKDIPHFTINVSLEGRGPDHASVAGVINRGKGVPRSRFTASSKILKGREPS